MNTQILNLKSQLVGIISAHCGAAGLTVVARECNTEREVYLVAVSVYSWLLQTRGNHDSVVIELVGIVTKLHFF